MVVTDSYGLIAAVGPDGRTAWSVDVGAEANPHAAELLPGGAVAVAASDGGWIRVYAGPGGRRAEHLGEFDLRGAHGVLWNPGADVLWALGNDRLCGLQLSDDRTEIVQLTADALPSQGGHDLQPVYGDRDLLWVTTSSAVYQFSKSCRTWSTAYPNSTSVNRADVKSIGSNPLTGEILQTVPAPGAVPDWVTGTLDICTATRSGISRDAQFYKARYWVADYQ